MEDSNKIEIDGRNVSLNWANERKERSDDRGGRGGYERRGRDRDGGERNNRDRSRNQRDDGSEKFTCFVGNLGYRTTERTIKDFFRDCGHVVDVRIAQQDGKSKGFCHVDFDSRDGLEKALGKQGSELDGRQIKIDESKPRGEGSRGGRDGGFRGGRGGRGGGRGRDRDSGYRRRDNY